VTQIIVKETRQFKTKCKATPALSRTLLQSVFISDHLIFFITILVSKRTFLGLLKQNHVHTGCRSRRSNSSGKVLCHTKKQQNVNRVLLLSSTSPKRQLTP